MRPWRQLHSQMISSDKLAVCSYEARWLWALLIAAQDDQGKYPWTVAKVRQLVSTTEWTFEQATGYSDELIRNGLSWANGTSVHLVHGIHYNGRPSNAHNDDIYEVDASSPSTEEPGAAPAEHPLSNSSPRGEERRGE